MAIQRKKWLKVRLSDDEQAKLQRYAESKMATQAQVVRDWIRRLPNR